MGNAGAAIDARERRWVCVVDPILALSRSGPWAVRQLARVLEVWVFRELWHILDNTLFFTHSPEVLGAGARGQGARDEASAAILGALGQWERVRQEHDLNGLRLFWVGDGIGESLLPEHEGVGLVGRYERLAAALEGRAGAERIGHTLDVAMRDSTALACALESAFVLTCAPRAGASGEVRPPLAAALEAWGIACPEGDPDHPLLAIEREVLRRRIAEAGLARLALTGTRLAVVHVVAPSTLGEDCIDQDAMIADLPTSSDPWRGSQAIWYPLC